jgi:hypothetical protein
MGRGSTHYRSLFDLRGCARQRVGGQAQAVQRCGELDREQVAVLTSTVISQRLRPAG